MKAFYMVEKKLDNKRIAKNTIFLYIRMIFVMAVTLYTSRIILQILGVEDFGIYNIVGGLVSMFSLISGSLSDSVSRFLTFEIGRNNKERLNKVFITSINVHIILALVVFIAIETIGLWFLNSKMNINPDKLYAANWVFQFSMLTFIVNIFSIPYNAMIVAYEKMGIYAYISILEVVCKLTICYLLLLTKERLILYSILLFFVALILRLIYGLYCRKKFEASKYSWYWDIYIIKDMFGFASWNFWGSMANMFKSQGVSMLINVFFGTLINAAQGIAIQISNAIEMFSSNFMKALNPQIIKSYAIQNTNNVIYLSSAGTRFAFYLLLLLSVPIFYNIDYILGIWLTVIPEWTNIFVRLILCSMLIDTFSRTLITIIQASGKISKYQIGVSLIIFMNFPLSYICLKCKFPPSSIYVVQAFISILCLMWRLHIVKGLIQFSLLKYAADSIFRPTILLGVIMIAYGLLHRILLNFPYHFVIEVFIGSLFSIVTISLIGMQKKEKEFVINIINRKIKG